MRILHICAGWQEWNGAANIARMLMDEQRREGHEVSFATWAGIRKLRSADEVWIHCGWLPCLWWAAFWGRNVHWMPEACYDPIRLAYHGWKKTLAGPIERFFLRRAKALVATCEAEKGWIESYLGRRCPPIEITDIKRFFNLPSVPRSHPSSDRLRGSLRSGDTFPVPRPLHLLYLGRRHPLKGVEYLETAVRQIEKNSAHSAPLRLCVKIVSSAFGDELEKVWDWCDVLVLPTLSENFGLVIAEALERGKRVITTDGAPAWECECKVEKCKVGSAGAIWQGYDGRLIYLKGYRTGTPEDRIRLLQSAIENLLCPASLTSLASHASLTPPAVK